MIILVREKNDLKREQKELEIICFLNGATYEPPKKKTAFHTRNRRKRLDEFCDLTKKTNAKQEDAKRKHNPET